MVSANSHTPAICSKATVARNGPGQAAKQLQTPVSWSLLQFLPPAPSFSPTDEQRVSVLYPNRLHTKSSFCPLPFASISLPILFSSQTFSLLPPHWLFLFLSFALSPSSKCLLTEKGQLVAGSSPGYITLNALHHRLRDLSVIFLCSAIQLPQLNLNHIQVYCIVSLYLDVWWNKWKCGKSMPD